jgi:hypothetical protein
VLNCDFILGSELQRPGKQSAFYFRDFSIEKVAGFAQSVAGAHAPNEAPWSTPLGATQNTPGTYASVSLNAPLGTTFLGTSSYVSTTNTFTYNWGSALSVLFSFKTTTTKGGIFVQANNKQLAPFIEAGTTGFPTSTSEPYFAVWMNTNGTLEAAFHDNVGTEFSGATPLAYNDGNLHVCSVTIASAVLKIYVDGVLVKTFTGTSNVGSATAYWIIAWGPNFYGGWPTFSRAIASFMSNVAVWGNLTLTATQVSQVFSGIISVASLAPDSYWLLEDVGNTAVDSIGTNPGTYQTNIPLSLFFNTFSATYNGVMALSGVFTGADWTAAGQTGIEPINPGDFIVCMIQLDPQVPGASINVGTLTDTLGNTYSLLGERSYWPTLTGPRDLPFMYYYATAVGAIAPNTAITFNLHLLSTGNADPLQFCVVSIPALTGLDQNAIGPNGASAGGTYSFSSPAITAAVGELILSQGGSLNSSGLAGGSPFTPFMGNSGGDGLLSVALITSSAGSIQSNWTGTSIGPTTYGTLIVSMFIAAGRTTSVGQLSYSQILEGLNFPFSIPPTQQVLGFELEVSGHQTSSDPSVVLTASVISPAGTEVLTFQLPNSDGTVVLGTPTGDFGLVPFPTGATFNNPNFTFGVVAQSPNGVNATFDIYALKVKVYVTPNPAPSFNYLKTFAETGGEVLNLALGSDGSIYQEDAINNPGVLVVVYAQIQPNSFAQSATVDDREFIAISNLQNGTDIPYTYTPPNFARLSQVGPGAPPSCTPTSAGSAVVSISQQPAFSMPTSGFLLQSDSPSDHGNFGTPATPGNVFTIILPNSVLLPTYTLAGQTLPVFEVGGNIVVAGAPTINGNVLNNDPAGLLAPKYYTITSIGQPIPGQSYYDALTFTVNYTTFYGPSGVHAPAGITIQSTIALMTTAVQVPNLEVGNSFQLTGTGGAPPAGYDSAWQVLSTPNASQLLITSTQLVNNVATYGFVIETGVAPVVGQAVTVTLTFNGNGIFNVTNAIISAATAGTFSVSLPGANINSAAENGSGIVFGTLFTFDAFEIIGNKTGGSITTTGVIASGQRMICYSFLTDTGYVTKPSPVLTFDVTAGASAIAVSRLLTGPPNVIARIIHLTPANGGQFYNIEEPVTVVSNGVSTTYTATVVNDNTSTSVTLSFTDGVLTAGQEIDIQGYNLFENFELGSCVALVPYAQRLFAIGEQNKIFNLLNYSFDGGIEVVGSAGGSTSTYPAGWTVDPTNGAGGSVIVSPIFGSAYAINNGSGSTKALYGMITQNAFQDEDQVAIIQPSTTYSVRVTCSVPTGVVPGNGNLVIDLFSKKVGQALGTFTLPLDSIGTAMAIFTGTLLVNTLAPVPNDLVIRIYASAILNGTLVVVDRIEPFPTEAPNLNGQIIGSYQNEFEQFDRETGVIECNQENQQAVVIAFTQRGVLYPVKTGSMLSITDNPSTEPSGWNIPRVVSVTCGATGPYAVTTGIDEANSGEEWALIGGQAGLFIFQGQQPIKLSEEIQSLWNQINWKYGFTMWVKNDIKNRRILTGVPLSALNSEGQSPTWLPAGVLQNGTNPTTPNAVIEMNYKQLNTAGAVEDSVQIHRSYSGKLIASDIVRKWSIWTIVSPCAAFLQRADTTAPTFLGNSQATGKIYELVDGLMQDDGQPIDQRYFTAGFVPTETGQGMQLGVTRYTYDYMLVLVKGAGTLEITAYPNTLDTPYADRLLPDFSLPASTNGDVELPVNEVGSRMFLGFTNGNQVGSGFTLSRVIVVCSKDPWSPVRGVNN